MNALIIRLGGQRERLIALAAKAQLPAPFLDGVTPAAVTTVEAMLGRALDAIVQADTALATVERQVSPPFLPGVTPAVRAFMIFSAWSLAAWLMQCGLLMLTGGTNPFTALISLCGMPLVAFAAALGTLQLAGQPRSGPRLAYSVKLGAVICFAGIPLMWVVLLAGLFLARG